MQTVEHTIWLPHSSQTIYDFITNPESLAKFVGRINRAWIVEREGDSGRVGVELDLPMRKTIETVGEVKGTPNQVLSFNTFDPFPLQFTWNLIPADNEQGQSGTEIHATLGFDFSGYGVPAAGILVKGLVTNELREDLDRLKDALEKHTA